MDPDSRRLRVSVTDGAGRAVRDGGLAAWLASIAPRRASAWATLSLPPAWHGVRHGRPDIRIRLSSASWRCTVFFISLATTITIAATRAAWAGSKHACAARADCAQV